MREAGAATTNDPAIAAKDPDAARSRTGTKYYSRPSSYNGRWFHSGWLAAGEAGASGRLVTNCGEIAPWTITSVLAENEAVVVRTSVMVREAVYHLYVIRTQDRDWMMKQLKRPHCTGIHYPIPLFTSRRHTRSLGYKADELPVSTQWRPGFSHCPFPATHRSAAGALWSRRSRTLRDGDAPRLSEVLAVRS